MRLNLWSVFAFADRATRAPNRTCCVDSKSRLQHDQLGHWSINPSRRAVPAVDCIVLPWGQASLSGHSGSVQAARPTART
jgi:hypothetical protein